MREVYLAGRGLMCALGPDVEAALTALRRGGVAPARVEVSGDRVTRPFFAIDDDDGDWSARARRIVKQVAVESGALAHRSGPLILASSSLDIGVSEVTGTFRSGLHDLGEQIAGWLDWRGTVSTVYSACTSALGAVSIAVALIRNGQADDALVLGVELRNGLTLAGFSALQLLASSAALPLGARRDGIVLGEAVAALHLSTRPARWRIAGQANVVNGIDPAGASAVAVEAMCRMALADSGLQPAQIDLIKLQAAGSPGSDATEAAVLQRVFDPLPALTSLKGVIGHTLGASGAAELALLTACIERGILPAAHYPLDESIGAALAQQVPPKLRYVMASILGFGGGHAAVVLEQFDR